MTLPLRVCSLFCLLAITAGVSPAQTTDYHDNPKFQKAMADAKEALRQRGAEPFAIDAYKKANKIAGGQCVDCLKSMVELQIKIGEFKDVIANSTTLEQLQTRPADKANAALHIGNALFSQAGEKPKPAQLTAIDAAYKHVLEYDSTNPTALYQDGRVLAMLGKDDEARAQWTAMLKVASPKEAYSLRAKHFIENPALAKEKMAPAFTVKTLEGKSFSLDDMGGRVVLIDFWATWCGPCNEELPSVKKIAKDFANDPFVLISVSWDNDSAAWKAFIDSHEMTWNQYRDKDHSLSKAFAVDAIPHYFTIDSDGVLKAEVMGSGNDVEGRLKKLVAKARAKVAQAAAASGQ